MMEDKLSLPHYKFSVSFKQQRPRATTIKCLLIRFISLYIASIFVASLIRSAKK